MKYRIRICQGVNCQNHLSEDLFRHTKKLTSGNPNIEIEKRNCMNLCTKSPNMEIIDGTGQSTIYNKLDYKKLEYIINDRTRN